MSVALLILLVLPPYKAIAHRLNVFAYYEDGKVNIESFFSDGTPCRNCRFSIIDEEGSVLDQGTLDDKGQAIVQMNLKKGVYIKVNASMGHLATFHLHIEDSSKTMPRGKDNMDKVKPELTREELRSIIREEIQNQLRPVIMELAKLKENRLPKILAAFGYIFGIFGLFALLKGRGKP